jgi:zinc transport system substrate-binding protein
MKASRHGVLAAALALVMVSCDESAPRPPIAQSPPTPPPAPARPLVVASIYPLFDFARNVADDRAEVVALVPPGVEPHDWEPSPRDVAQLQRAKVFVYNGGGFEPWVDKLARDIQGGGVILVNATDGLPLLKPARGGHDRDHQRHRPGPGKPPGSGASAAEDPHVWLDPVLAKGQVERIRDGLIRADPGHASVFAQAAREYAAKLDALDAAFQAGLRDCARRDVVVSHAAFAYLTSRYRLIMLPMMGLAPEAEPSPAEMAALIRLAKHRKVKYIFFETLVNAKLAETIAHEVGAETLVLNPIEGLTRDQAAAGATYLTLMEENLRNLRRGLDCT